MSINCPKCKSENQESASFCADCGTQLPSPEQIEVTATIETPKEELTTGSTFAGRYQIIEELGKGGMGRVYKVLDKEVNAKVALKLIKPEIASDKKTIERFRNELKVARDIAHKNVCRMYHLGKEEGAYYITMEYVSGEDLKSFIRRSGLISVGKAIAIANQVCEGLLEAHRLGVVHRDLKPQNIMIDKDGNARIMDFGIARSLRAKGITGSGVMIGTPEYMSPEQVEGKEADQRADIYSLGVILYEMVTGKVPFEGDTPFSIGVKQKSEIPRPPIEINEQIPEDLNRLILKCMEKDKEKRYQSVGELHSELMSLEKGIPTTERVVPERKPLTSREITVQFNLKKLFIPALVIIAVVIIGLILWQILPSEKAVPSAPPGKSSLAVMYFENNTGDERLDHWRKAIAELLITDLSQSKYIKVLSRDRLYNILNQISLLEAKSYSSEDLKKIANRGGVNHILQGGFAKADNTYRINYTLQNIGSAELIGSDSLEGEGEKSIFSMVDELTNRIKTDLKLSQEEIAADLDKNVEAITTGSPEAYKYYIEGISYDFKGDLPEAIRNYRRAIEIDPEFALSHNYLAWAYSTMGYNSEAMQYYKKSFELRDQVSDRERYLIEGDYYWFLEVYDKAIDAYNKLLQIYPEDWAGNVDLGIVYRDTEHWDQAIERFEFLRQNKDESLYTYTNLVRLYMAKGLYAKAREVIEYYLNNFPEYNWIILSSARSYLCQGKFDLALNEVEKALSNDPTDFDSIGLRGSIFLCKGDLKAAEKDFRKQLESTEQVDNLFGWWNLATIDLLRGRFEQTNKQLEQGIEQAKKIREGAWETFFRMFKAYIYLRSGKYEEASKEYDNAEIIAVEEFLSNPKKISLYWKGYIYLEMKSMDKAEKTAEELRALTEKDMNKNLIRLYHNLVGMIELKRENFSEAIENFTRALSLLPYQWSLSGDNHALFIDPLALAYYRNGDLDKAREEYEMITELTTGRLSYGDIYAKSFYMLGKIYEQQGNTAKAIENYEKFLDLWKDADPGLPDVDDARTRLAQLTPPLFP